MNWNNAIYRQGADALIPKTSGVYVITKVTRVDGFPTKSEPLYVGKSNNLRRRTLQHQDLFEPNPKLNGVERTNNLEIWWKQMPVTEIGAAEGKLIRNLQPAANRRGKGKKKPRDDCCEVKDSPHQDQGMTITGKQRLNERKMVMDQIRKKSPEKTSGGRRPRDDCCEVPG